MYRKSNSLYMMRFLCIDLIHYPPLKERPPFMRRQKSRPFSDQVSIGGLEWGSKIPHILPPT